MCSWDMDPSGTSEIERGGDGLRRSWGSGCSASHEECGLCSLVLSEAWGPLRSSSGEDVRGNWVAEGGRGPPAVKHCTVTNHYIISYDVIRDRKKKRLSINKHIHADSAYASIQGNEYRTTVVYCVVMRL